LRRSTEPIRFSRQRFVLPSTSSQGVSSMPFGMPISTRRRRLATVASATLALAGASAAFSAPANAATLSLYVYSYQNPSTTTQTVELYASAYSGCSIKSYSWNFGDGSATSGPTAYDVTHRWTTVGTKTLTITASDSCGNSTTATYAQEVVADAAPKAAFTTTASSSNPLTIYADPADTTDTDPTPVYEYDWNWGDGSSSTSYEDNNNGGLASHTYAKNGTYTVTLYPYDTDYNRSTVSRSVTVGDSGPQCTITGTAGNDVLTGTAGPDVICGLAGD